MELRCSSSCVTTSCSMLPFGSTLLPRWASACSSGWRKHTAWASNPAVERETLHLHTNQSFREPGCQVGIQVVSNWRSVHWQKVIVWVINQSGKMIYQWWGHDQDYDAATWNQIECSSHLLVDSLQSIKSDFFFFCYNVLSELNKRRCSQARDITVFWLKRHINVFMQFSSIELWTCKSPWNEHFKLRWV